MNRVFEKFQSGCRSGHTKETTLLHVSDDLHLAADSGLWPSQFCLTKQLHFILFLIISYLVCSVITLESVAWLLSGSNPMSLMDNSQSNLVTQYPLQLNCPAVYLKVQFWDNVAARLLTGTIRREHITPVLASLHWLPITFLKCFYNHSKLHL